MKKTKIGKKIILIILGTIALLLAIVYLIAILAPFMPQKIATIPSFLGLLTPVWVILLAIFIIIFICLIRWIEPLILFILLFAGYPLWHNSLILFTSRDTQTEGKEIKLLTYNIMAFNECNRKELLEFLVSTQADIICLEEIPRDNSRIKGLVPQFDKAYPYMVCERVKHELAIFSRYPIESYQYNYFEHGGGEMLLAHINIDGETIALAATHFESYHLSIKQRQIIKQTVGGKNDDVKGSLVQLLKQMDRSFPIRREQAIELEALLSQEKHPTIVAGDLNDVPSSYSFHILTKERNSAYTLGGRNILPYTYNRYGLFFLIDHILIDKNFKVRNSKIYKTNFSDHLPLEATITIKE